MYVQLLRQWSTELVDGRYPWRMKWLSWCQAGIWSKESRTSWFIARTAALGCGGLTSWWSLFDGGVSCGAGVDFRERRIDAILAGVPRCEFRVVTIYRRRAVGNLRKNDTFYRIKDRPKNTAAEGARKKREKKCENQRGILFQQGLNKRAWRRPVGDIGKSARRTATWTDCGDRLAIAVQAQHRRNSDRPWPTGNAYDSAEPDTVGDDTQGPEEQSSILKAIESRTPADVQGPEPMYCLWVLDVVMEVVKTSTAGRASHLIAGASRRLNLCSPNSSEEPWKRGVGDGKGRISP